MAAHPASAFPRLAATMSALWLISRNAIRNLRCRLLSDAANGRAALTRSRTKYRRSKSGNVVPRVDDHARYWNAAAIRVSREHVDDAFDFGAIVRAAAPAVLKS